MVTDWYSGQQHPIREGWYERDYSGVLGLFPNDGKAIYLDLWMQDGEGRGFWYVSEPKGQVNDARWDDLPWRGLRFNVELTGTASG